MAASGLGVDVPSCDMSDGLQESDKFQALRELLLDAEHRDLEDLRARLYEFEVGSPDRLSRDLAEALRKRAREGDRAFEDLVEALQPGTEAAIERSVAVDKSRLAGSLFPIMGPAIRSYVAEFFRNLARDFNETIRNTTSFERLKWRVQARLAGRPFSEYVILKTASYKVEELVGGLWRLWLLLSLVLAGILAGAVFHFLRAGKWDAFAGALRDEPGIEVIGSNRWEGITGLRDPLARDPAEIARASGIDPAKVNLDFKPYLSLHPGFVRQREAEQAEKFAALAEARRELARIEKNLADAREQIAAERKKFETRLAGMQQSQAEARRETLEEMIRSRYGHLTDLKWSFTDAGVTVSGGIPEPEFSRLKKQLAALPSLGEVDASGLTNAGDSRIDWLREIPVNFDSGKDTGLEAERKMRVVAKSASDLKAVADRVGVTLVFKVISHPLVGRNRGANQVIERSRAQQVRDELIAAGIPPEAVTVKLSEEMDQAGDGVDVVPERAPE